LFLLPSLHTFYFPPPLQSKEWKSKEGELQKVQAKSQDRAGGVLSQVVKYATLLLLNAPKLFAWLGEPQPANGRLKSLLNKTEKLKRVKGGNRTLAFSSVSTWLLFPLSKTQNLPS